MPILTVDNSGLQGKSLEDFRITSPVAMEEDEDARLEELTRPDNVKA